MKQLFLSLPFIFAATFVLPSCERNDEPQQQEGPQSIPATSVTLDQTLLILEIGETETLTATVEPSDATDPVLWQSSDDAVASVRDGVVSALGVGDATITAAAGSVSATCEVSVKKTVTLEPVDLGLSVLWADRNLGAETPEGYGDYYAWGETKPRTYYDWDVYNWASGSKNTLTKYNTRSEYGEVDNLTRLENADDAAYVATEGKWRIPTKEELSELMNLRTSWTEREGVKGRLFKSKTGDATIFIPAGGAFIKSDAQSVNKNGCIVSSEICAGSNAYNYKDNYCWYLYFDSDEWIIYSDTRARGWTVRPVMDKPTSE